MKINKVAQEIIGDYCETRNLYPVKRKGKTIYKDYYGEWEDMDEQEIIDRYFEENSNWCFEDEGYEIHDCEFFLKQAKNIDHTFYINVFTDMLNNFRNDKEIVARQR